MDTCQGQFGTSLPGGCVWIRLSDFPMSFSRPALGRERESHAAFDGCFTGVELGLTVHHLEGRYGTAHDASSCVWSASQGNVAEPVIGAALRLLPSLCGKFWPLLDLLGGVSHACPEPNTEAASSSVSKSGHVSESQCFCRPYSVNSRDKQANSEKDKSCAGGCKHQGRCAIGPAAWLSEFMAARPRHVLSRVLIKPNVLMPASVRSRRNGVDCLLYVMRNARITDDAIATWLMNVALRSAKQRSIGSIHQA